MRTSPMSRIALALVLAAGGAVVSAQQMLPDSPKKAFGASITPAYDGWYTNPDGTYTMLVGYYNRNWTAEVDIPVGPANHFEPGEPDRGQPTHFLPNRNFGMFTIKVPKNMAPTDRLWWVLTLNGVTQRVGLVLSPDYNITPQRASEESPGGKFNTPPVLRFAPNGPASQAPVASVATAIQRTATVGVPMDLELFVEDDALYTSGSNAPMGTRTPPPVTLVVAKYRGPGSVTVSDGHRTINATKGGKPAEDFAGSTKTTVTFGEPGDYVLHVTANDFTGRGGSSAGCCWTTAMVKVKVTGGAPARTTTGQ